MNECVLSHDSSLRGYTRPGTIWADGMNFVMMNFAPGAGSIARPVDQQSGATTELQTPPVLWTQMQPTGNVSEEMVKRPKYTEWVFPWLTSYISVASFFYLNSELLLENHGKKIWGLNTKIFW